MLPRRDKQEGDNEISHYIGVPVEKMLGGQCSFAQIL